MSHGRPTEPQRCDTVRAGNAGSHKTIYQRPDRWTGVRCAPAAPQNHSGATRCEPATPGATKPYIGDWPRQLPFGTTSVLIRPFRFHRPDGRYLPPPQNCGPAVILGRCRRIAKRRPASASQSPVKIAVGALPLLLRAPQSSARKRRAQRVRSDWHPPFERSHYRFSL